MDYCGINSGLLKLAIHGESRHLQLPQALKCPRLQSASQNKPFPKDFFFEGVVLFQP